MNDRDELLTRMDERMRETREDVKAILIQTTATNGRVTSLENWRSKLNGGWKAILIMAGLFGALLGLIVEVLTRH
jgi:hypothetical protein